MIEGPKLRTVVVYTDDGEVIFRRIFNTIVCDRKGASSSHVDILFTRPQYKISPFRYQRVLFEGRYIVIYPPRLFLQRSPARALFPIASPHTMGNLGLEPGINSSTTFVSFFAPWWSQLLPFFRFSGFSREEPWDIRPQTAGLSKHICAVTTLATVMVKSTVIGSCSFIIKFPSCRQVFKKLWVLVLQRCLAS